MSSSKLKTLLTITYNDLGISYGPSIHYLELWNSFAENYSDTYHVKGVSPAWTKNTPILPTSFTLRKIKLFNIRGIRQVVYDFIVSLHLLCAHVKKSVIYIRVSSFHFFSILLLRIFRIQYIIELNGIAVSDAKSRKKSFLFKWFINWQERQLMKNAKAVICVTNKISNHANTYNKNTHVINNGVSNRFFVNKKTNNAVTIIYVGTFTAWDGHNYIPELAKAFPEVNFLILGDGVNRVRVQKKCPKNVVFMGYVKYSELPKYYAQADAGFVLYELERHQSVGISSLKLSEYMASGLPIFTTYVGKNSDWITNNEVGVCIVEPTMETIKANFQSFLMNIDLYSKNMKLYREKVFKDKSWVAVAKKTHEIIENSIV